MIKIVLLLAILSIASACFVRVGYVIEKSTEDYEEYIIVKKNDVFQEVWDRYEEEYTRVYKYTQCDKYLVKDYPDYILVIKDKKNNNKTSYYVKKYIYDRLGIEHTYDQDIHHGNLFDSNNTEVLIDSWVTKENEGFYKTMEILDTW